MYTTRSEGNADLTHHLRIETLNKSRINSLRFVPLLLVITGGVTLAQSSCAVSQELVLLTLGNDKIGEIESLADNLLAEDLIDIYYELLPMPKRMTLLKFDDLLEDLIVDYEVARTAADSAEITEVLSDMDAAWMEIQKIHNDEFSFAVIEILNTAYGEVYPLL